MPPLPPAAIKAKLESSRKELLDLTFRNPLLNYRPLKARGVEIIESSADTIYPLLVTQGRKLTFAPMPGREDAMPARPAGHTVMVEVVSSHGPAPSESRFDEFFRRIEAEADPIHATRPHAIHDDADADDPPPSVAEDIAAIFSQAAGSAVEAIAKPRREAAARATLQTECSPVELHKRLLNTMLTARTFVEEQGVNTLFLALGMLTWHDAGAITTDVDAGRHRSPLILVPVQIERATASDRFTLRYTEEDLANNVSLASYLGQYFDMELPLLPDRDDLAIGPFLEQIALLVSGKTGWAVDPNAVALAFFSFNKYLMYQELDDDAWPANEGPTGHPILGALLGGGFHEPAPRFGEDDQLDRVLPPAETRTVVEADGSQVLAIEDVKQGRSLVIQGPPGTGKSQSITNIIAETIGQGKTVLFVSEKMAALEVVKRRLDSVGLGDSCLELHSNKTNKKAVLEELKRTLGLGKPVESRSADDDLRFLVDARDRLNAYCDAVNAPVGASGWTPHTLYGEWLRIQAAYWNTEMPRITLSESYADWSSLDYRQREQAVTELQAQVVSMGTPKAHPFWGCARASYASTDSEEFRESFTAVHDTTASLIATVAQLALRLALPAPPIVSEAEALAAAVQRAIDAPEHAGMQFSSGQWMARRKEIEELLTLGAHLAEVKRRFGAVLAPEAWETDVRQTRSAIAENGTKWYKFVLGDWRGAQKEMRLLCAATVPVEISGQLELLDAILDYRRTRTTFTEQSALGATLFGAQWQGERSDWPVLGQLLQWIAGVHAEVGEGRLPRAFVDFLSGSPDLRLLAPEVGAVQAAVARYRAQAQSAVERLDFRAEWRFGEGQTLAGQPLTEQATLFAAWAAEIGRLQQMTAFNHRAAACRILDLGGVVDAAASGAGTWLTAAFQRIYCQALLRLVFGREPLLANFNGAVHARTADQFRALDVRLLENNRVRLASQHYQAISRLNGLSGAGGEGQLRVLTREFEKKARHLPIRQLVERAGHAIQAIKPVFMMSPLSVATFLAPGTLRFDLVVFDEASQVKPVDALGALARGAQAVVVGDSKQLPPTSFFDSLAQSDGVEDDNETADMESVLGLFVGQGAPQRMLRWHYRSRHESLIAVSNQEFYENRLIIFPSPDAARAELGLSYRYLPDTVYDRGTSGTNRAEAKAVAEAALAHARIELKKPHQKDWHTLGIAAFSMGQMQAILDQLELLRRLHPDAEPFFNATAKNEPFFVKNLENVQGDERDVIYISVGYGRDKAGNVSMNFGPLNRQGGERRLNVLISRARLRCEVFTNLLPDDLDLSRTSARGIEAFKTFLAYARSTDGSTLTASATEAATPFETEVLSVLRQAGYEVVPQVGCAGYFVDLAVVHPRHPGRYLLGIECDGPNYQSARSARDRDRLRSQVLAAMGWRLHRIWSTDWVHRYDDEVNKLLAIVAEAAAEPEPVVAESDAEPVENEGVVDVADTVERESESTPETPPEIEPPIERDETAMDDAFAAVTNVPPYVLADLSEVRPLDVNDNRQLPVLAEIVTHVVAAEGPIHWQEVSRRLATPLRVARLTETFHGRIATAAALAERAGKIRRVGEFYWHTAMQSPTVRSRSGLDARSRNITLVAPEEIAAAVRQAVTESYGLPVGDIARVACRLLGFDRTTPEAKARVDAVVDEMLKSGELDGANGTVTAAPETSS